VANFKDHRKELEQVCFFGTPRTSRYADPSHRAANDRTLQLGAPRRGPLRRPDAIGRTTPGRRSSPLTTGLGAGMISKRSRAKREHTRRPHVSALWSLPLTGNHLLSGFWPSAGRRKTCLMVGGPSGHMLGRFPSNRHCRLVERCRVGPRGYDHRRFGGGNRLA
jgi:hypothetical protein